MFRKLSYPLLANLINLVAPLVIMPYAIRKLGASGYGYYVHANVIYLWVAAVLVVSIGNYCAREITLAMDKGGPEALKEKYSELIAFQFLASVVATLLHLGILLWLLHGQWSSVYYAALLPTFFSFANVDWYFFCTGQFKVLFWRILVVRLISLGFIFWLVRAQSDLSAFAWIMFLALAGSYLWSFVYASRGKLRLVKPNLKIAWRAKYFYANSGAGSVYQYMDQFLIELVANTTQVAFLNIAKQVLAAASMAATTVCRYYLPQSVLAFSKNIERPHVRKLFLMCLGASLAGSILLVVLGPDIVAFLGGKNAVPVQQHMTLVAGVFFVTSMAIFIDTQISIPSHNERVTMISNGVVAVVSLSIFLSFVKEGGFTAALWGLLVGETAGVAAMMIMHIFVFKTSLFRKL